VVLSGDHQVGGELAHRLGDPQHAGQLRPAEPTDLYIGGSCVLLAGRSRGGWRRGGRSTSAATAVYDDPDRLDIAAARTAHLTYGAASTTAWAPRWHGCNSRRHSPAWPAPPDVHADRPAEWLPPTESVHGPLTTPLSPGTGLQ
jgi:hypothetical protein